MKLSLNLNTIIQPFTRFIERYRNIIFFLIIASGLSAGMILTITTITLPETQQDPSSTTTGASFDEATIKQLNELGSNASVEILNQELNKGRNNPFVE